MHRLINICYICSNVNGVVRALVEAFNEFITCVVADIDKKGIKNDRHMYLSVSYVLKVYLLLSFCIFLYLFVSFCIFLYLLDLKVYLLVSFEVSTKRYI